MATHAPPAAWLVPLGPPARLALSAPLHPRTAAVTSSVVTTSHRGSELHDRPSIRGAGGARQRHGKPDRAEGGPHRLNNRRRHPHHYRRYHRYQRPGGARGSATAAPSPSQRGRTCRRLRPQCSAQQQPLQLSWTSARLLPLAPDNRRANPVLTSSWRIRRPHRRQRPSGDDGGLCAHCWWASAAPQRASPDAGS